eukprot:gene573-803_t
MGHLQNPGDGLMHLAVHGPLGALNETVDVQMVVQHPRAALTGRDAREVQHRYACPYERVTEVVGGCANLRGCCFNHDGIPDAHDALLELSDPFVRSPLLVVGVGEEIDPQEHIRPVLEFDLRTCRSCTVHPGMADEDVGRPDQSGVGGR